MQLTDFDIEYKGVQLNNILMASWVDMPDGFTHGFTQGGKCSYTIMIKVVYVDELGRMLCEEDYADNFRFRPKTIDIIN